MTDAREEESIRERAWERGASGRRRDDPILAVEDLRTIFETDKETIRAVDGIDFDVFPGETVGLVGESGSGKSVTARSIMGLIDAPGRIDPDSSIRFDGEELTGKSDEEWRAVRGSRIALVKTNARRGRHKSPWRWIAGKRRHR